jgi:hypothetical protein
LDPEREKDKVADQGKQSKDLLVSKDRTLSKDNWRCHGA